MEAVKRNHKIETVKEGQETQALTVFIQLLRSPQQSKDTYGDLSDQ